MKSGHSSGLVLGWIASLALHVGVVAFAFVGLPHLMRPTPTPPPPVLIEFVAIADKTQQVVPEAEKQEEEQENRERSKSAAAETVAEVPADAVPLLEKKAPPKIKPKAKPKPKPKPKLSNTRKLANVIRPRSKPKPPSRLKSKLLRATIDKAIKEEIEVTKKTEKKQVDRKKADKPKEKPKAFAGLAGRLATASIRDALSQKLAGCWNFPVGAKGADKFQVKVRISLRTDGSLRKQPEIIQAGDLNQGFYRVFVESARRAVLNCAPYSDVAKSLFDLGEDAIDFNFDGAEFAGG